MTIHIKPENRGKFTALKKRTGKSASWFKAHGTPAQKKMATFALNAKKWKHGNGGNLFNFGGGTLTGSNLDYGMSWNSKVDRLRAINSMISKIGQKADSIASGMDFGNMGSVSNIGSQGWGNTGNVPEGFTGNDIDASQSFAANEFGFACGGNLHKCGGNLHCSGGNLFDYGGDFSNGLTFYNNGGTHEENPYEGVQVGTDNQGTPNLVEEGEVRYKDYVFSNRLSLDEELAEKYNIPKKYSDATFAYIAEKMGEESKEREYDPISQRGLKIDMEKLRAAQEETRAIKAQQEQMQQAQQIADELGVSVEDVLAAMQMQQEEAAQQEAMAQQQMMQQPSPEEMQMIQQQPSEEEMMAMQQQMPQEAMPIQGYAYGGTLFDNAPVNLFAGGTDDLRTNRYLKGRISEEELWNKYTRESLLNIVSQFEQRYNAAKTPEEKAQLRQQFIQEFNGIQESYAKMYQDGVDPRIANDIVKQHQAAFDTFGGNYGYKGIENDLYNNGRTVLKDTTKAKFTPDGLRQSITDTRHLGSNYYDEQLLPFYRELNERLHNSGINYGLLDRDSMRYNGHELYGLSEYNPEVTEETPDEYVARIQAEQEADLRSKGYQGPTLKNPQDVENLPTTNSNNQQPTEQTTAAQANPKTPARVNPNYSILDFVPLYEYLTAGKPDYYQPDALVDYTNRLPKPTYKPIGDFVQYHPFDRQYAANQQRARTEAQIRNNWNISGGNRGYAGAMNLATNMQGQLADAEMQRQADAANLQQQMQVATFNRGTNQYNADAFNRLQLAMPSYYQLGLQSRMGRAQQHYMIDKDFGASKSANLNTFLRNMYARRREAEDAARVKWLADSGAFGELNDPGYPYPVNGNNTLFDWLAAGNWRNFGKKNNNG